MVTSLRSIWVYLMFTAAHALLPPAGSWHHHSPHGDHKHRRKTLAFATHHKTGTVLMEKASHCFENSSIDVSLVHRWSGEQLPANAKIVHVVRNPFDLAVSAYQYHKDVGEEWTLNQGSAFDVLDGTNLSRNLQRLTSYTEYLRQAPADNGIRAELSRLEKPRGALEQMVEASRACEREGRERCMEVCLEAFTHSSASYDSIWYRLLLYAGLTVHEATSTAACLAKYDLHRQKAVGNHVTSAGLDSSELQRLRSLIRLHDESLGHRLQELAGKRYACSSSAGASSGQALANPFPFWAA